MLNKKSIFYGNHDHTEAFEKIKQETVNQTENTHSDVNCNTRTITDESQIGIRDIPRSTPWERSEDVFFCLSVLKSTRTQILY